MGLNGSQTFHCRNDSYEKTAQLQLLPAGILEEGLSRLTPHRPEGGSIFSRFILRHKVVA